jgi:hypothetical protein
MDGPRTVAVAAAGRPRAVQIDVMQWWTDPERRRLDPERRWRRLDPNGGGSALTPSSDSGGTSSPSNDGGRLLPPLQLW